MVNGFFWPRKAAQETMSIWGGNFLPEAHLDIERNNKMKTKLPKLRLTVLAYPFLTNFIPYLDMG